MHELAGAVTVALAIGQRSHDKGANPMRNIDLQAKLHAVLATIDGAITTATYTEREDRRHGDTNSAMWSASRRAALQHVRDLIDAEFFDFTDHECNPVAGVHADPHTCGLRDDDELTDDEVAYAHRHRECGPDCCITGDRCEDDRQGVVSS